MSYTNISPYQIGDKIAQLVIMEIPKILIEEVDELDDEHKHRQTGDKNTNLSDEQSHAGKFRLEN